MMRLINLILASILTFALFSCKDKKDPSQDDLGYSFYPINEGDYYIYDVVDTLFQGVGVYDISNYQVKEEIREIVDVDDEQRYQLYLYYKKPTEEWKDYPDSNWTVFRTGGRIIRIEDNVRFVKLVFPLSVGKTWDGNITDTENDPQKYYTMTEVRRPFSYDSFSYNETVSVVQFDSFSALDEKYAVEVFANTIGLVYKEIKVYNYDQDNLLAKNVEYGQHYIKKLVEYGRY